MKKSIGKIKDYTPKFGLIIPRFDIATWHDYIEENFRNIDALFYNLFGINNYSGIWKQITSYTVGQVLFIGEDKDINGEDTTFSGRLVKVLQDHTTDNSDYFNVFYNLHPEYYELFDDASTAQVYAKLAKDWSIKTDGTIINAGGVDTNEYSAKYYANLSKERENSAKISADNAKISENSIKICENIIKNAENVVLNTQQEINQIAEEVLEKGSQYSNISKIFAIGEQEEVEELSPNMLSSRGFSNLSAAIANAPEDVPIDESNIIALQMFKGPKGDKGDLPDLSNYVKKDELKAYTKTKLITEYEYNSLTYKDPNTLYLIEE